MGMYVDEVDLKAMLCWKQCLAFSYEQVAY